MPFVQRHHNDTEAVLVEHFGSVSVFTQRRNTQIVLLGQHGHVLLSEYDARALRGWLNRTLLPLKDENENGSDAMTKQNYDAAVAAVRG